MTTPVADGTQLSGKALVATEDGTFTLEDVVTAPIEPDMIGVQTHWSGVSFGTEFAVLARKLDWGPFPLTTGYMGAGVVTHVGSEVTDYALGDRVYWRRNIGLWTTAGDKINCASGVHCSVATTITHGTHAADHIPDDVSDELASMFVLPAVGLNGVNQAQVGMGDSVVVIGVGQIGLAVVAAAAARGARVMATDIRQESLDVATALGATSTVDANSEDLAARARAEFGEDGVDFVFESTGRPDSIDLGISLLRQFGAFVWQGNYGEGKISFTFLEAHHRRIRMVFPCDDGYQPARRAVMHGLSKGWLNWGATMTDRIEAADAPAFYSEVLANGAGKSQGATIHWAD